MAKQSTRLRPTNSPEAQENRMISMAMAQAEKMLENGTCPTSIMLELIKRGSTKAMLEKEILSEQKSLIHTKTDSMQSAKRSEDLYEDAINAMRIYSGQGVPNEEDDD